jgi:hypothetical protein
MRLHFGGCSSHLGIIPAEAGIHLALMSRRRHAMRPHFGGCSSHLGVIPAEAGIHLALMHDQHGFPLDRLFGLQEPRE